MSGVDILELNRLTAVWLLPDERSKASIDGVTTEFGLQEGSAFFGSFDLVNPTVRRGGSVPGTGIASPHGKAFASANDAANAACGPVVIHRAA